MADPGFPRGGGANSPGGGGRQHTILPNFPKNCMKLKEFGPPGGGARPKFYYVDPPLKMYVLVTPGCIALNAHEDHVDLIIFHLTFKIMTFSKINTN